VLSCRIDQCRRNSQPHKHCRSYRQQVPVQIIFDPTKTGHRLKIAIVIQLGHITISASCTGFGCYSRCWIEVGGTVEIATDMQPVVGIDKQRISIVAVNAPPASSPYEISIFIQLAAYASEPPWLVNVIEPNVSVGELKEPVKYGLPVLSRSSD